MLDSDEFVDETFRALEAREQEFRGKQFEDCTFINCNLAESQFSNCRFFDCVFRNCDLSMIGVQDAIFARVTFEESRVIGVNWTVSALGVHPLSKVTFNDCALNYGTFSGLSLAKTQFTGCSAIDVDFSDCDLSKADFAETDLQDSRFFHTDLTEANFVGAKNYQIAPTVNTVAGAKFALPEAIALLRSMDIVLVDP